MLKILILSAFLFFVQNINSQTLIHKDTYDKEEKIKYIMPIRNNVNDDILLLTASENLLITTLFNKNYQKKSKIDWQLSRRSFKEINSFYFSNDTYYLGFLNRQNSFIQISSDGISKYDYEITTDFSQEVFLHACYYKDKLYILTISDNSHIIIVYIYDLNCQLLKKVVVNKIYNNKKNVYSLNNLYTSFKSEKPIIINDNYFEMPREAKNKIYKKDNILLFSSDNNFETILYKVDLNIFNITIDRFPYPIFTAKKNFTQRNSIIIDDNLFQVSVCRGKMILQVLNINNTKDSYRYELTKKSLADFKNSIFKVYLENKLIFSKPYLKKYRNFLIESSLKGIVIYSSRFDSLSYIVDIGYYDKDIKNLEFLPLISNNTILVQYGYDIWESPKIISVHYNNKKKLLNKYDKDIKKYKPSHYLSDKIIIKSPAEFIDTRKLFIYRCKFINETNELKVTLENRN